MPTTGLQAELVPAEGSAQPKAHLVASIPQVLQGQPLALSMEETDQSLHREEEGLVRALTCAEER